ncbi:MAG: AMP-binding protein, partial [Desulfuromonadales bacterium]|nr:AMP-binding protein [Desulfuromonadales bacterium]NIR34112.1 AMP-binding protein [Desulfuromonadales bacterium]NIS41568.1 AMP-binding protein [Desulfuromonadales bacterium]
MGNKGTEQEISSARLREVVGRLVEEFHPGLLSHQEVTLDSSLDRDLGLDSLARVELLGRIEKAFGVSLSERALADAETPRDLLRALGAGSSARSRLERGQIRAAGAPRGASAPQEARNLVEVLEWHCEHHPDRSHVRFYADEGEGEVLDYRQLFEGARRVAAGLQEKGLQAGEPVALMLPTGSDYLYTFFGILLAGGVPVPIYPPVSKARIEDHLQRQRAILGNCSAATLVTMPEASGFSRLLMSQNPSLRGVVTVEDLTHADASSPVPELQADDTAFIQYTSGSTGTPKGVVLTHANLLANIRAMGKAVSVG